MTQPLADCWLKLDRAKHHVDTLKAEIEQWAEAHRNGEPPLDIGKEFDAKANRFVYKVTTVDPPPRGWGALIGDAVNNFRAALDYLAWRLVKRGTDPNPRHPRDVQFPIVTLRKHFNNDVARRLPGVLPAHRAVVERHQPFHAGNQATRHPLSVLADLSNNDKHRELQVTLPQNYRLRVDFVSASDFLFERVEPPAAFPTGGAFQPGTEVAYVYGRPTGPKPDVTVAFHASLAVAFQNGLWVWDTFDQIGAAVAQILSEIEPLL